jgi:xeroderma pigmentosum group C-complementing protein
LFGAPATAARSSPIVSQQLSPKRKKTSATMNGTIGSCQPKSIQKDVHDKEGATETTSTDVNVVSGVPTECSWIEIWCRSPVESTSDKHRRRWIHVDPVHQLVNQPQQVQVLWCKHQLQQQQNRSNPRRNHALSYALGVEHDVDPEALFRMRLTDVTPRYTASWTATLRKRGLARGKKSSHPPPNDDWWSETLQTINRHSAYSSSAKGRHQKVFDTTADSAICLENTEEHDGDRPLAARNKATPTSIMDHDHIHARDDSDDMEVQELQASAGQEAMPTSKAAFQTHLVYVLPSLLGVAEVLSPDARMCGVFKGELVYRRINVSTALPARRWPYHGRMVKEGQKPIKRVKRRKKAAAKGFCPLKSYGVGASNDGSVARRRNDVEEASRDMEDDGMMDLFAVWQTDPWSPVPVGPGDSIPVNEYRNVELELLNPGLVHIDIVGAAQVAKKLSIPYAPCLVCFEGHGGNRTPTIRGIVVHLHSEDIVREAMSEVTNFEITSAHESRRKALLQKWKRLMMGLLIKERVEREYGDVQI